MRGIITLFFCAAVLASARPLRSQSISGTSDSTTIVRVDMYLNRIHNLDTRAQSFDADFYLWLKWRGNYSPEKYEFVDGKGTERLYEVVEEDPDGTKYLSVRIRGTFLTHLDVSNYPQDKHVLSIVIEDYNWTEKQLRYVIDSASTSMYRSENSDEWQLRFLGATVESQVFPADNQKYSSFRFLVEAKRSIAPFLVKILIPIILVVLMSMLTFFIPPTELQTQVGLGATALLTIIALNFVIGDELPDVAYLTNADILLIGSYLIVFLALCESIVTNVLHRRKKIELSRRMDKACRVVFPGAYIAFLLILFAL